MQARFLTFLGAGVLTPLVTAESWGPFGHGWSYRRLSVHMLEPTEVPLIGMPEVWSAGQGARRKTCTSP